MSLSILFGSGAPIGRPVVDYGKNARTMCRKFVTVSICGGMLLLVELIRRAP
jgi:hypothetical protein